MIVGQEVPIIENSQITSLGQTINSVSYQSVGVILYVTPHINPDGMVTLDIAPQVSQARHRVGCADLFQRHRPRVRYSRPPSRGWA